jgi:hypothetical protein
MRRRLLVLTEIGGTIVAPSTTTDDAAIEALCLELSAAFARRDECRQRLKAAEEDFDRVEEQLAALLEGAGMSEIRHERWVLAPKRTVTWRTPEDHKEDMLSLIREGAPSLVRETVNSSSLNAFLRREEERLDEESPAWWVSLKTMLTRSESLGLSMRKR